MSLALLINDFIEQHESQTIWVAYSGGLDSHVLLHLLAQAATARAITVKAIHIHHGLSPHADAWQQHCEQVCNDLNVDLIVRAIDIVCPAGESVEETARDVRYAAFESVLHLDDVLVTAHHQDDQAETVLLQLVRGAGPKGLSAMPSMKKLGAGWLWRPLLNASREMLVRYAKDHHLSWVEDESNQDQRFTRNYMRNEVLPLLQKRWPSIGATLARSASHCSATQAMAEDHAANLLDQVKGTAGNLLSVEKLTTLNAMQQRFVLRSWIEEQHATMPDSKKLNSIINNVIAARWDAMPQVIWGDYIVRRYRDNLYLSHNTAVPECDVELDWDMASQLNLPVGTLLVKQAMGQGLLPEINNVKVMFRQQLQGDRLAGRLKKLFQENSVPPWLRASTPIVCNDEAILSIVGFYVNHHYSPDQRSIGKTIELKTKRLPC